MIDSAIILAVSAATQRSNLTEERPSAMLPALGKPMVVRVMDRLYQAGIRQYVVVVGINEGAVASYLNKQWKPDAKIEFLLRANESTGTLITRIAHKLDKPFLLASYNTFTNERFIDTILRQNENSPDHLILTGTRQTLSSHPEVHYGIIKDGLITSIATDRPEEGQQSLILAELAVCGRSVITHLKALDDREAENYGSNLFHLTQSYLKSNTAKVEVAETSWVLRVERDSDLLLLNKRLLEDSNDSHILSELPYSVKIIPPVRIDPQVSVGQSAIIGPYVYVERGSSIGYGAKIRNAIVLERATVPADSENENVIVTTKGIIKT